MFKECLVQGIEVITGERKRCCYAAEEKARFVALSMKPGYSVSLVARQYGITPSLLFKWKRLMSEGGQSAIAVSPPHTISRKYTPVCQSSGLHRLYNTRP